MTSTEFKQRTATLPASVFLTELTLDPPEATSDRSGPPQARSILAIAHLAVN